MELFVFKDFKSLSACDKIQFAIETSSCCGAKLLVGHAV